MPLFGWKSRWNRRPDQIYMSVTGKDDKASDESETLHDSRGGRGDEIRKLRRRVRLSMGLWAVTAAGLLFIFFTRPSSTERPPLLMTPVPSLPPTIVTFEQDPIYATRPSLESDRAWNALLPPGRGFVFITNGTSKYPHLQPGQATPWGEIYSVALFHQVHCLGMIRKQYWMLLDGLTTNDTALLTQAQGMAAKLLAADHIHHCFDYMRQSLMCAGDMAMEWPRTETDGRRVAVDGWGVPHECRSWDAISEYMQKNHFNHSTKAEIAPD